MRTDTGRRTSTPGAVRVVLFFVLIPALGNSPVALICPVIIVVPRAKDTPCVILVGLRLGIGRPSYEVDEFVNCDIDVGMERRVGGMYERCGGWGTNEADVCIGVNERWRLLR